MEKSKLHNIEDKPTQQLKVLREIILSPAESRIQKIESSLDQHAHSADDVAEVLAEAIIKRQGQDKLLDSAMAPVIQRGMEYSIQRNKEAISNVIFPVLGPSIRKYVLSLFQELVQSLQSILETTVSVKSLQWRFESWRANVPYAEVVLANSLLYRVEDVLLIHKNTGLLINHVSHPASKATDPDLTSAVLKAIQDFVQDSFEDAQDSGVHVIEVANFKILIEQKGSVFIAARVRGFPPQDLSIHLEETLEDILLHYNTELQNFNGDVELLEPVSDLLKDCLVQKPIKKQKKSPVVATGIVAALALFVFSWFGFEKYKEYLMGKSLDALNQEPGIFVSSVPSSSGEIHVLRDVHAKKIEDVVDVKKWPYSSWVYKETPFASSEPEIIIQRLKSQIDFPTTLELKWDKNSYSFSGMASKTWWNENKNTIKHFPELFPRKFSEMSLVTNDILEKMRGQIKEMNVYFGDGQAQFTGVQISTLNVLDKRLKRAIMAAQALNLPFEVRIEGHTSQTGEARSNKRLSLQRALSVQDWLSKQDVSESYMRIVGMGEEKPVYTGSDVNKYALNQRVHVYLKILNENSKTKIEDKDVSL